MDDAPEEAPVEAPAKRAAASKAKTWLVDTDSDDDNMLGDVGDLVKGIGAPAANSKVGRVSLHAMAQPNGSVLPKAKPKSSRAFDVDSMDDTNYEALAMSSPRKPHGDDIDDFLSDDDIPVSKPASSKVSAAAAKPKAPLAVVPTAAKKRGRPAGTKKSKDDEAETVTAKPKAATKAAAASKPKAKAAAKPAAPKPVALSPAAKAYAKKKAARVISDDEDEDDVEAAPAPAARARPGRAAAAKAKPIVLESSDVEDSFNTAAGDEDKDDFSMDDSEF
jgi:DNA topoisomerase-2